ncbi:MAG: iron-sulfur cluster assembly scaffold protein [Promethearchaeota archaeon]
MYSKHFLEHFMEPKNVDDVKDPDGLGKSGTPECGDKVVITLKIVDGKIIKARFKTFGCPTVIASSSAGTVLASGERVENADKIGFKQVEKLLGGVPLARVECSNLAVAALRNALNDYIKKKKSD